jgi:hypothetical protein
VRATPFSGNPLPFNGFACFLIDIPTFGTYLEKKNFFHSLLMVHTKYFQTFSSGCFIIAAAILSCMFFMNTSMLQAEAAYAQLSSLMDQIPASAGANPVIMEVVHSLKNVELGPNKDLVIVKEAGNYFIYASGQIGSLRENAIGYLDLWYVKNGKRIPNSNAQESLGKLGWVGLILSPQAVYLEAGDTLALNFSTSKPSLGLVHLLPENEPAVASVLFSMFKLKQ